MPWSLLLLSLLLCSCNRGNHWAFDQVHSDQAEFRSTKITWRAPDPTSGIHVELLNTKEHLKVYLNIHSIPVSPYRGDPQKALLTMEIEGEKRQYEIRRLEGGQRFLLPEPIADILIEALQNDRTVSLFLSGYNSHVVPKDFSHQFKKLLHPIPFRNPFHLQYMFTGN